MVERIAKFGGLDGASLTDRVESEYEPDSDPRGSTATIDSGMHFMEAVDSLAPCATTEAAYLQPDSTFESLRDLGEAVAAGEADLEDELTITSRHNALVNPRRSTEKHSGGLPADSDADLWHIPTDSYVATPPSEVFQPLARVIDSNDGIPNGSVYGEFRERRNGGEVFGEIMFDTMEVDTTEGNPVKLGLEFGWNYFGSRAFFVRGFAQDTSCKNSIRALTDKRSVMHHNRTVNWGEMWSEFIEQLGVVGDALSQAIMDASSLHYTFDPEVEDYEEGEPVLPFRVEDFYEFLGLPESAASKAADHARERADASADPDESSRSPSAWSLHSGATYWLSWFWNGSEDSRAFREYRRSSNDILFNPEQTVERIVGEYRDNIVNSVVDEVADEMGEDADEAEVMAEVERRLDGHEGIATVQAASRSVKDRLEEFKSTEERLEAMSEAMQVVGR